jgi:hypothetical protein
MTSNAKADHPDVINTINSLKGIVPFGIDHNGEFIEIKNISINGNKLTYLDSNNESKSVSSFIVEVKQYPTRTASWISHLCFKDGYGKIIKFKKFVADKYNLEFS